MDPYADEDEAMAAAIAASLEAYKAQETRPGQRSRPVEIIDSDEDEDEDPTEDKFQADLQRALKASVQEAQSTSRRPTREVANDTPMEEIPNTPLDNDPTKKAAAASDFLRMRAQLEKERLARAKGIMNMKAPATSSSTSIGKKRSYSESQSDMSEDERQPAKRNPALPSNLASSSKASTSNNSSDEGTELFYEHELRPTANRFTEKSDLEKKRKTFRMSELIGDKDKISFAILSSYSTDPSWMYGFFAPGTPVILVNQPHDDGNAQIKQILPNWIMAMPYLRGGRGAMHVKLMLIFYKSGRLRFVIPTANFIDYDWRDIENAAWVQDFPSLSRMPIGKDANASSFSSTLTMVLTRLHIPAALETHLREHPNIPLPSVDALGKRWDFSKARVKLIPSMAGKFEGWDQVIRQGHVAMMKAVTDIGGHAYQTKRKQKTNTELVLECQGSSIGQYTTQWLNEIYSSCAGISPEKWLHKSKQSRSSLPFPPVKILFPSLRTVQNSIMGIPGGGTMFCKEATWKGANFPRELFHDSNSKRGGVLMHTKMILGLWRPKTSKPRDLASAFASTSKKLPNGAGHRDAPIELDSSDEEDDDIQIVEPYAAGWLYVGSHNFTPSAWGTVSGTGFTPIINITNYELGVLIPLSDDPVQAEAQANEMASWVRPARKYNLGSGGDMPWCQS